MKGGHDKLNLKDIFRMKAAYYMVVLNCFFGYGVNNFINENLKL